MDAASNNGVDNIRDIREEVEFIPTTAKYRVYIIDEVHMLSIGAFNALLKTLEEPPEHVIFILATTEPQKIPTTILSRCQRFDFKRISLENIIKRLNYICENSNIKMEENAVRIIANLADGAMRDAISILDRCVSDGDEIITEEKIRILSGVPNFEYLFNMTKALVEKNIDSILEISKNLKNEGKDLNLFIWELIKFERDISIFYSVGNIDSYSKDEIEKLKTFKNNHSQLDFLSLITDLSDVQNSMKWANEPSVMFEVGLIKICLANKEVIKSSIDAKSPNLTSLAINTSNSDATINNTELSNDTNELTSKLMNYLKENVRMRIHTSLLGTTIELMDDGIVHIKFNNVLNKGTMEFLQTIDTKQVIKQGISSVLGKDYPVKYDFFK